MKGIALELLSKQNIDAVRAIHREDIPESWVDDADTLWELTQYGLDHNCIGHTYAVKYGDAYIGVILLGEAIPWETDPEEMKKEPFYRLMGFVVDNRYRSQGIGGKVLEMVIDTIYEEYGVRPIALGVHKENHGAARFYERHGFSGLDAMEGNDRYYIRYPKKETAMTNIFFVRHAEPNYNNHDDLTRELSPKGLQDRELVTKFLADKQVDIVLSSPYKRAVDTVAHFAALRGLPIATIFDFRERKVDSDWIDDFDAFTRRQWADFNYKLTDGETLAEVQKRNIAALLEVIEQHKGKTVVIGSHGTALSTIINYFAPQFGIEEFTRIKSIMPWIVHFTFSDDKCARIEEYDLFSGVSRKWM